MQFWILSVLAFFMLSIVAVRADPPAKCLEPHPKGVGLCYKLAIGFYYNPATKKCENWSEGGCSTEGGHSYTLLEECVKECEV